MKGWLEIEVVDESTGARTERVWSNIVTLAGVEYYTARMADTTPTQFVDGGGAFDGILELGTAGTTPTTSSTRASITALVADSQRACDGSYPTTDDSDPLNPLTGLFMSDGASSVMLEQTVTYKFSYPAGTFTGINIDRAIITNPSPGASEPVLAYTVGTPFTVNATSAVIVRWNHRMQAVTT